MTIRRNIENSVGAVILEWNELGGGFVGDRAKVKSWLSRSIDHARLAYRHNSDELPRRFVVVATANQEGAAVLPSDPSGQRRYGVVHVGGNREYNHHRVRAYINECRDQLWAEAKAQVQAGRRIRGRRIGKDAGRADWGSQQRRSGSGGSEMR